MIYRCTTLGHNSALKPAEFRFCCRACSCWWLIFSVTSTSSRNQILFPRASWPGRITALRKVEGRLWESLHCRESWKYGGQTWCSSAGSSLSQAWKNRGSRTALSGMEQALLCSTGRGAVWAPLNLLAQLSWGMLWSLVLGTRGRCQDVMLLEAAPVACTFPGTWSLSKSSVGVPIPQEGLFGN